jgi:hypothetical protein
LAGLDSKNAEVTGKTNKVNFVGRFTRIVGKENYGKGGEN